MTDDQFYALLKWADNQMERWFKEVKCWNDIDKVANHTNSFMDKLKEVLEVFKRIK